MNFNFVVPLMTWSCETSADSVRLSGGSKSYGQLELPWPDIVQAGICPRKPIKVPAGAPIAEVFPAGERLLSTAQEISAKTNYFYVAFHQGGRRKIRTYSVPKSGPDLDAFVCEWKQRLGPRWSDESISLLKVRKQMGISNWWVAPAGCLIILLVAAIMLGFLALRSAIPPLLGIAIVVALWSWRKWVRP